MSDLETSSEVLEVFSSYYVCPGFGYRQPIIVVHVCGDFHSYQYEIMGEPDRHVVGTTNNSHLIFECEPEGTYCIKVMLDEDQPPLIKIHRHRFDEALRAEGSEVSCSIERPKKLILTKRIV